MDKKAFLLYQDYRAHLDLIPDSGNFRMLIEAIFDFGANKKVDTEKLCPMSKMAFSFISANILRDKKKYENTIQARSIAGSKGGKAKVANASKAKQNKQEVANQAVTVIDTVTDNVIVKDIKNKYITDQDFEKLKLYIPNRDGTNNLREARRYIDARLKEGHTLRELCVGLQDYRNYCERAGLLNTAMVMTMSRFFGRDKLFLSENEWANKGHSSGAKANKFGTAELNDHLREEAKKLV